MPRASYRSNAIRAAKDLLYGDDIINQITAAKSDAEIERIMYSARNRPPDRRKKARTVTRCLSSNNFTWSM